jgi:COP9 signalosome complex subunit 1
MATGTTAATTAFDGFDVDAYAAKYSGRNRINRLLFLAKTSDALRHDAHEALMRDLKNSLNMKLYLEVAEAAAAASEDVPESVLNVDHAHVETVKLSASQQHERLEQELNSYKSTMIKESIRVGFLFLVCLQLMVREVLKAYRL